MPHRAAAKVSLACLLAAGLLAICGPAGAQKLTLPGLPSKPAPAEPPKDPLGRSTPRGTVLGFLRAEHKGDHELAMRYMDTPLHGKATEVLAYQLAVVLDRGLYARLNHLSDRPEGSLAFPAAPDQEVIGIIDGDHGDVDIVLERVDRKEYGRIWLFSPKTLAAIPALYQELNTVPVESVFPEFLVKTRIAAIPLFEWLAVFFGMPGLFLLLSLLSRVLRPVAGGIRRRVSRNDHLSDPNVLPIPVRLLFIAISIAWFVHKVTLPLLEQEFWSDAATIITIAAVVWSLILLNGVIESFIRRRMMPRRQSGPASLLRLGRTMLDLLLLFAGLLFGLHHFGVNLTAALAGLGVGGIAVALAAQKTLENVIGGISIIFDQVIQVGDRVKVNDREGFVEDIGLRSTRIRTLDRTVLSVPNGQLAIISLENISIRDRFWFHHILGLRYETPASKMRFVLDGLKTFMASDPRIEHGSNWVRFLGFGTSSLNVELYGYVFAPDLSRFLETQQALLLDVMEVIQRAGGSLAYPSQIVYVAGSKPPGSTGGDTSSTLRDFEPTRQTRG
jgi:MscS family membrane protein